MQLYYVYIIECADGLYYTGHTDDIGARFEQHVRSNIKCYTASRKPLKLVYVATFSEQDQAKKTERQIKGWSRVKKTSIDRG